MIKNSVRVHNHFHATLVDSRTGDSKEFDAYNLVTDRYYYYLAALDNDIFRLSIGVGTGTPAPTDTHLFQEIGGSYSLSWGYVQWDSPTKTHRIGTITFSEDEVIGNLTEVGLVVHNNELGTHALFTDSEGNPIVIPKTEYDRLTITVTVYVETEYDFPDFIIPYENIDPYEAYRCEYLSVLHQKRVYSGYSPDVLHYLARTCYDAYTPNITGISLSSHSSARSYSLSLSSTLSTITGGYRLTTPRYLAADKNVPGTYQIRGVDTDFGFICLPNHDLFPPINLELTATGDGSTTDFNFGIPELMSEVQVYIDNVLQDPTTYIWGGKDFNRKQAFVSAHGTYLIDWKLPVRESGQAVYGYTIVLCNVVNMKPQLAVGTKEFIYDFEQPRVMNRLVTTRGSSYPCTLFKSDDNETWIEVAKITTGDDNTPVSVEFEPTTARYWKTQFESDTMPSTSLGGVGDGLGLLGCFDFVQPQLKFNTAPPEGSVIKVVAKSEYPIKNSNWIIEPIVVDFSLGKKTST